MGSYRSKLNTVDQQRDAYTSAEDFGVAVARICRRGGVVKNLFIGPTQSGKTTIIRRLTLKENSGKNISICIEEDFQQQKRNQYISIIRQNVVSCVTDLCQLLKELGYESQLKEESRIIRNCDTNEHKTPNRIEINEIKMNISELCVLNDSSIIGTDGKALHAPSPWMAYIELEDSLLNKMDEVDEILMKNFEGILSLWHSKTVQQALTKNQRMMRMVNKTCRYQYLNKLDSIVSSDYAPSEFDVKCSYIKTKSSLSSNGSSFKDEKGYTVDYSEANSEMLKSRDSSGRRKKTLTELISLGDFDAIYFVVSLADYDEVLPNGKNGLEEALADFSALVNQGSKSGCLHIGLYLNKIDIFRDKIWRWSLSDVETFEDYTGPVGCPDSFLQYIITRFENIYRAVANVELHVILPYPAIDNISPTFYERPLPWLEGNTCPL